MLPSVVPKARIMAYNYDSTWHTNAPKTRLRLCGEDLVGAIHRHREGNIERPIIFVGHSLGGNVIVQVSRSSFPRRQLTEIPHSD